VTATISYELGLDDYLDSQMTYNANSESVSRTIRKGRISLLSFYVFAFLVTFPALHGLARAIVMPAIALLAAAHIALARRLYNARNRRIALKILRDPASEVLFGKKKLKVTDDELTYLEKARTTRVKIDTIKDILESEANYFVFYSAEAAIIIPRALGGETREVDAILDHIRAGARATGAAPGAATGAAPGSSP